MNVRAVMDEMSLAAYEMAEAATHDREAKRLRDQAAKRLAVVHANLRDAEREAKLRTKKSKHHENT